MCFRVGLEICKTLLRAVGQTGRPALLKRGGLPQSTNGYRRVSIVSCRMRARGLCERGLQVRPSPPVICWI